MGYEAPLNISQKVFVYRFLYTRVLKWTHEYKKKFVFVNCFYVRVGLRSAFLTRTTAGVESSILLVQGRALVDGIVRALEATSSILSFHARFKGLGYKICFVSSVK
jgi:hypothetical protein